MIPAFLQLELHIFRRYRLHMVAEVLQSIVHLAVFYYLAQSIGPEGVFQGQFFPYVVLGLAFIRIFQSFTQDATSKLIDWQYQGILEPILATPGSRWRILLSAGMPASLNALVRSLLMILLAHLVFKASWPAIHWWGVLLSLTFTFFFCQALSLISLGSILLWKRVNLVRMISSFAALLLSGVYFPVKILPEWLQLLAKAIPLTHAMNLFRWSFGMTVDGISYETSFWILCAWTLSCTVLAILFFQYAERKVLESGKLAAI